MRRGHRHRFLIDDLTDGFIDAWVDAYSQVASPMSVLLLFPIHGAAARVAPDATAFPHRGGTHVGIYALWKPGDSDEPNVTWVRNTWQRIQPFSAGGL